jgi:excisionase family DNA binding protein
MRDSARTSSNSKCRKKARQWRNTKPSLSNIPVAAADFKAYLQQELIDTAGAAELMGCTRQNIQDLVRRGRIKPVMTLRNNFLFLRSEL